MSNEVWSREHEAQAIEAGGPLPGQPLVSIIVVNWNTRDLLAECLQSILDQQGFEVLAPLPVGSPAPLERNPASSPTYAPATLPLPAQSGLRGASRRPGAPATLRPCEILVVDNASTDGSADMVRTRFPQVQLIVNRENAGFAAANNRAIGRARGQVLFLLNPDAYLKPGALVGLARFLEQYPEAAVAGPNVLNPDGSWQATAFRFPTLWDLLCEALFLSVIWPHSPLFARKELGGFQRDAMREVDWVQGCAMAIRRPVWEGVGPFDEGYWMYVEELDWCRRARSLGHRIFFTPDAQVVHYGRRAVARARSTILPLGFRSHFRYFRKFHGPGIELIVRLITLLQMGLRAIASSAMFLISRDSERARWRENWRAYTGVMAEALKLPSARQYLRLTTHR